MWHHKEFDPVVLALWPDGYIARQAQSSLIQAPQKEPLFHHQRLLQFRFAPDKDVRFGGHFFFYLSLNWTSLFLFKKPGKTSFIIILLFQFCRIMYTKEIPAMTFTYILFHGLQTPCEKIAFNARTKIHSQIFRYGKSIFCLPRGPKFLNFFDLCLHWVSMVRSPCFIWFI